MEQIDKNILREVIEYCKINNIDNTNEFLNKLVRMGFNFEKYGSTPISNSEKIIEKIVEKEVVKEVPVEVIKEVVVEKLVTTNNDDLMEKYEKLLSDYRELQSQIVSKKETFKQPPQNRIKNIINWVSKSERNTDDTWGED
jgi:hypothetical protein